MKDIENSCKIALVQAEPVMFDKSASLKKVLQWIAEAAAQKPDLIVFPELFIPGYPVGMNFGFCIGKRSEDGRKDWKRYYDASVVAGETEFQQLAKAAQETGAYISLGFSERDTVNGTLYNNFIIFPPVYKTYLLGIIRENRWYPPIIAPCPPALCAVRPA